MSDLEIIEIELKSDDRLTVIGIPSSWRIKVA